MNRIEKNILLKIVLERAGKEVFDSVKWYIDDDEKLYLENIQLHDRVDLLKAKLDKINSESTVTLPRLKSVEEFNADLEEFYKKADEEVGKLLHANDKMEDRFDRRDEIENGDGHNTGWCIND